MPIDVMAGPHQRWTQSHITALRDRLLAGDSVGEIATGLARPPVEVAAMMARLRLRSPHPSDSGPT